VHDVPLVQAAQNVVPVAVTAGDKIDRLRQWASSRCLSADRAGVYSRSEGGSGGRVRMSVLQLSCGLATTEGRCTVAACGIAQPIQWGRGFAATEGSRRPATSSASRCSFNGAVASQPRKDANRRLARWRPSGFNGAAASQPRKGRSRRVPRPPGGRASMGPRLRSHGKAPIITISNVPTPLQWGRGFAATESR
jgi:hypothetical protein